MPIIEPSNNGIILSGESLLTGTGSSVSCQLVDMGSVEVLRSSWDILQSNFQQIEDTLNNNALYLADLEDEVNQMEVNLKSQSGAKITDLPLPVDSKEPIVLTNLRETMLDRVVSTREEQLGSDVSGSVSTLVSVTYTVDSGLLEVYREGLRMYKGRDYTETTGSSITWLMAPAPTDVIEFYNREIV